MELGSGGETGMEESHSSGAGMEQRQAGLELSLVGVWHGVEEVLSGVVCAVMDEQHSVDWLRLAASSLGGQPSATLHGEDSKEEGEEGERKGVMLALMMTKILTMLSSVLRVAKCEDVEDIVKGLGDQVSGMLL